MEAALQRAELRPGHVDAKYMDDVIDTCRRFQNTRTPPTSCLRVPGSRLGRPTLTYDVSPIKGGINVQVMPRGTEMFRFGVCITGQIDDTGTLEVWPYQNQHADDTPWPVPT
jgi:hypothetical protein